MSVASVTIAPGAWSDPRVERLARLLGISDPDVALIKLAKLWARCTFLGTDEPPLFEIEACLDERGPDLLVRCGLGELLEGGSVRVRGGIAEDGTDRMGWFRRRHPELAHVIRGQERGAGRAAGGKVRASSAPRAGGRFVKSTQLMLVTSNHQHPALLVRMLAPASPAQLVLPDQDQDQKKKDLPRARGGAGPAGASSASSAGSPAGPAGTAGGVRLPTARCLDVRATQALRASQQRHRSARPALGRDAWWSRG
jgi:hypothetical protein